MDSKVKILMYDTPLETDGETRLRIGKTFISTSSDNQPKLEVAELSLPITPENRRLMEYPELCASQPFNESERPIRIVVDDRTLFEGFAMLRRVERRGDGGRYILALETSEVGWQQRLENKTLSELQIECNVGWDADSIVSSWTEDVPVRFLPVTRNVDNGESSPTTILNVTKSMAFDNYHPFLHLRSIIYKSFEDAGYSVDSIFMSSPEFNKLYMSGAYPTGASNTLDKRMGFLARRLEPITAVADYSGSVYASPLLGSATIGNLVDVDTASAFPDTYSNGGCLSVDDLGRVVFTPKTEVVASFLYKLRYKTEYYIRSRERLTGFDRVWITPSEYYSFEIVNSFVDQRDYEKQPNMEYNLMVFDFTPGDVFMMRYELNGTVRNKMFYERSNHFKFGESLDEIGEIITFAVSKDGGGTFETYEGDWAVYYGFCREQGVMDVALSIRSAPERLKPGRQKRFDQMVFDGAVKGMTLRMEAGVSINPIFFDMSLDESIGSWQVFSSLDCTQREVVDAVCKMFNLRVIEDSKRRMVRIETADYLADIAEKVDWNGKVDLSQGWQSEDVVRDMSKVVEIAYQSDSLIREWEELACEKYATCEYEFRAAQSPAPIDVRKVPLFHPSISDIRVSLEAPSASIIVTKDSGGEYTVEHFGISTRVVQYEGLKPLPSTETWGWPTYGDEYPYAAFHSEEYGFTLSFRDRDGVVGLHQYYDREARLWRTGKRVHLNVQLRSEEVMMLLETRGVEAAERNVYEFELDGERHLFTLEHLDYTFGSPQAKCTFIKID